MENSKVTAEDIKRLMIRSFARYQRGEISEVTAYRENTILTNILKAIDTTEAEERLRSLELTLLQTQNL